MWRPAWMKHMKMLPGADRKNIFLEILPEI